jgi:hypothetical protein
MNDKHYIRGISDFLSDGRRSHVAGDDGKRIGVEAKTDRALDDRTRVLIGGGCREVRAHRPASTY